MKPEIENLIKAVELSDISSIRAVLNRIVEVAADPQSSAFDLKDAIETDPPLAARVLKRANSAYYGMARRGEGISDIQMAIVCIGFETVKELALSQSVCTLFRSEEDVFGYTRAALWTHCVATATAGRLLFRREFQLPGGQAHAAGLLHDIGLIVEDQCMREAFRNALQAWSLAPAEGLCAHERRVMGFSHAEVGRALAHRWDFPVALCRAIGNESPVLEESLSEPDLVAAVVHVADMACQARRIGFVEMPQRREDELHQAAQKIGLRPRALGLIMDEAVVELERMRQEGWF